MSSRVLFAFLIASALTLGQTAFSQTSDDPAATALQQAQTALAAAEKDCAEQPDDANKAKVQAARQALLAEQAWAARQAVVNAEAAKTAAERSAASMATQVKAERAKLDTAKQGVEKAAAEKLAAEKALEAAPADQPEPLAEAKKALEQKTAALQQAEQAVAAATSAVEKATAEQTAAGEALTQKKAELTEAMDAAALAHAEALGGLKPITSKQWDYAKARHLLFRAGFGGPPEEIQKLVEMGPHKAVAHLVEYHRRPVANIEVESEIFSWERPLEYERRLHVAAQNELHEVDGKRNVDSHAVMVRWWVRRLLESPRPLEEKLVLFWHDHFASSYRTLGDTYLMYQQNQFFRRYADNFDALLHGIVQDPAMIRYLNNDENEDGNVNENFGRELLELFSLGEENSAAHCADGYSEKDVRDANTRALTGASYERYSAQFRFYHDRHDSNPKTLLGKSGNWGTHEAIDIMLEHPATAQYVTKKLWRYFASWDPEPETVERLSHVLRENGYRMRPLLTNLFLSEEFYSDRVMGNHIKSPVELLVGTAKTMNMPRVDYQNVRFLLASMGQSLFDPPSVAGWEEGRDWVNTNLLMARYTATTDLVKKANLDLVALLKDRQFQEPGDVVDHLAERCLPRTLSAEKRQALVEFLGPLPPSSEWSKQSKEINAKLQALLILLVSSPEYQVS